MKVQKEITITKTAKVEFTKIRLLTPLEALSLLTQKERINAGDWWLMTQENFSEYINGDGGFVSTDSNKTLKKVRPAIEFEGNLKVGDYFTFNKYRFKVITQGVAFMMGDDIGYSTPESLSVLLNNWFNVIKDIAA